MDDAQTLSVLGARIRKTRKTLGLSLNQVARLSGISAPALSLVENGRRDLRLTSLHRIAEALRIAPADLLSDRSAGHAPLGAGDRDLRP
ncbi:helix-turn-helix domain-containing protein [Caulobacter segnis]